jgi:hypothetical protein
LAIGGLAGGDAVRWAGGLLSQICDCIIELRGLSLREASISRRLGCIANRIVKFITSFKAALCIGILTHPSERSPFS